MQLSKGKAFVRLQLASFRCHLKKGLVSMGSEVHSACCGAGKMGLQAHHGLLEVFGLTSNLADSKRNSKRGGCAGYQATRCRKGMMRWDTLCRGHQTSGTQTPYLLLLKELTELAAQPGMPATAPLYVTGHCMGGEYCELLAFAVPEDDARSSPLPPFSFKSQRLVRHSLLWGPGSCHQAESTRYPPHPQHLPPGRHIYTAMTMGIDSVTAMMC